jgi:hypothetical protein
VNLEDNFWFTEEEVKRSAVMAEGGPKNEPSGPLVARKNVTLSRTEAGMFSNALPPAILCKLEKKPPSIKAALFIKGHDDDAARRPERLHDCCLDLSFDEVVIAVLLCLSPVKASTFQQEGWEIAVNLGIPRASWCVQNAWSCFWSLLADY